MSIAPGTAAKRQMVGPWCSLTEALLSRACPCTATLPDSDCWSGVEGTASAYTWHTLAACSSASLMWECEFLSVRYSCVMQAMPNSVSYTAVKAFAKRCAANTYLTSLADDGMSLAINVCLSA